jgi:putative spermidine/putrescine transport system substrate-binding protein
MKHHKATRAVLATVTVAAATVLLVACSTPSSGGSGSTASGGTTEMNILSFSGHLNDVNKLAAKGFEEKYNVKINWVEGDPAGNVAKVLAGKDHQTYDIAFVDSKSQYVASGKGAWDKLDPKIVTNLTDISPVGIVPNDDGLGYGVFPTGIFYNADKFKEMGWTPPTDYDDILNKDYCNVAGLMYIDDVYGVHSILSLGAQPENKTLDDQFTAGLAKLEAVKDCFPNFESSSGGFDQKILTDQYYVGLGGLARILPMQDSGKNMVFVVPKEGAYYTTSTANIAVNAPHEELAQQFVNWMAGSDAQTIEMQKSYYVPTNTSVVIPDDLVKRGLVGGDALKTLVRPFDLPTVSDALPDWTANWDAIFS